MDVKTGFLYHLHDSFYDRFNNCGLSFNKSDSRPVYFALEDKNNKGIFWVVPLSSNVEKYKTLYDKKIEKHGRCDTIIVDKYAGKENAFLIQNLFPVNKNYIKNIHTIKNKEVPVIRSLENKIIEKINKVLELHKSGKKVVFSNIDYILNELKLSSVIDT